MLVFPSCKKKNNPARILFPGWMAVNPSVSGCLPVGLGWPEWRNVVTFGHSKLVRSGLPV